MQMWFYLALKRKFSKIFQLYFGGFVCPHLEWKPRCAHLFNLIDSFNWQMQQQQARERHRIFVDNIICSSIDFHILKIWSLCCVCCGGGSNSSQRLPILCFNIEMYCGRSMVFRLLKTISKCNKFIRIRPFGNHNYVHVQSTIGLENS